MHNLPLSNYLANQDINGIKVIIYAHKVTLGGKESSIFEDGAYTIAYIEDAFQVADAIALEFFHEVFFEADNTAIDHNKFKLHDKLDMTFIASTNILADKANAPLYIFTINKQFNMADFIAHKQDIYFADRVTPEMSNDDEVPKNTKLSKALHKLKANFNRTVYKLVDVRTVNNTANSVLIPTYQARPTNITHFYLTADDSYGFHKVQALGYQDGLFASIPIVEEGFGVLFDPNKYPLEILKVEPIEINDEVSLLIREFDGSFNIREQQLVAYTNKDKVDFNTRALVWSGDNNDVAQRELWRVFLSIFELTAAFANGFKDYQIKATDGRSGINPDATIGGIKIGLLSGVNSGDALNATDGRIADWKRRYNSQEQKTYYKQFLALINLLSNIVASSYAIGNGRNNAHRIYNFFYLEHRVAIGYQLANNLNQEFTVGLRSEYYDRIPGSREWQLKPAFKRVDKLPTLGTIERVKLPELGDELTEINASTRPGNIDPTSDDVGKFIIRVPMLDRMLKNEKNYLQQAHIIFRNVNGKMRSTQTVNKYANPKLADNYKITKVIRNSDKSILATDSSGYVVWPEHIPIGEQKGTYVYLLVEFLAHVATPSRAAADFTVQDTEDIVVPVLIEDDDPINAAALANDKDYFLRHVPEFQNAYWNNVETIRKQLLAPNSDFYIALAIVSAYHNEKYYLGSIQLHGMEYIQPTNDDEIGSFKSFVVTDPDVVPLSVGSSGNRVVFGRADGELGDKITPHYKHGKIVSYDYDGYYFNDRTDTFESGLRTIKAQHPRYYKYFNLRIRVSYTATIKAEAKDASVDDKPASADPQIIFNKRDFAKLKARLIPPSARGKYAFKPQTGRIDSLYQLVFKGIFGNHFQISIWYSEADGTGRTLVLPQLDFPAKYDETQTKLKINF